MPVTDIKTSQWEVFIAKSLKYLTNLKIKVKLESNKTIPLSPLLESPSIRAVDVGFSGYP